MNWHRLAPLVFITLAVTFGIVCLGCDNEDPAADEVAKRNKTNIQKVANAYILYAELNGTRAPKSEDELVKWVTEYERIERNLKMMGIEREKFAGYFVSEIDNEEFTVRWGASYDPEGAAIPLVFEAKGIEGVRRVALSDSRILSVDDAKYKRLLAGKISSSDAGQVVRTEDE